MNDVAALEDFGHITRKLSNGPPLSVWQAVKIIFYWLSPHNRVQFYSFFQTVGFMYFPRHVVESKSRFREFPKRSIVFDPPNASRDSNGEKSHPAILA
jgi:hypothetical protein